MVPGAAGVAAAPLSPRGRRARGARGAPAPRPTASRSGAHRGASGRSARRSPRNSRRSRPRCGRAPRRSWRSACAAGHGRAARARGRSPTSRGRRDRRAASNPRAARQRLARLADDLVFPGDQLLTEVDPLALVHERLVLRRTVIRGSTIDEDLARAVIFFPAPSALRLPACRQASLVGLLVCDRFRFWLPQRRCALPHANFRAGPGGPSPCSASWRFACSSWPSKGLRDGRALNRR